MCDHYFSASPSTASRQHTISVTIRGRDFSVAVDDGVFSNNRIDKGTAVFLHKVPEPFVEPGDTVVDLGCGWGPLSLALGVEASQARLIAVDVNERALALTRTNLREAGLRGEVMEADEALRSIPDGSVRLLWSNPPIRIGKKAVHSMLESWLAKLSPVGEAFLVVQKNLGADSLAKWISQLGYDCTKIGSAKGFRILRVAHIGNPWLASDSGDFQD